MKNLLIVGAGGHGNVVAETAYACGYNVSFLDDRPVDNVVGTLDEIDEIAPQYDGLIVSIGDNKKREELLRKISNLVTLIHPCAYVSPPADIGTGSIILPGAVIHSNAKVGKGCIVSIGALIDHDAEIGDYCHINSGAVIGAGASINSGTKVDAGVRI